MPTGSWGVRSLVAGVVIALSLGAVDAPVRTVAIAHEAAPGWSAQEPGGDDPGGGNADGGPSRKEPESGGGSGSGGPREESKPDGTEGAQSKREPEDATSNQDAHPEGAPKKPDEAQPAQPAPPKPTDAPAPRATPGKPAEPQPGASSPARPTEESAAGNPGKPTEVPVPESGERPTNETAPPGAVKPTDAPAAPTRKPDLEPGVVTSSAECADKPACNSSSGVTDTRLASYEHLDEAKAAPASGALVELGKLSAVAGTEQNEEEVLATGSRKPRPENAGRAIVKILENAGPVLKQAGRKIGEAFTWSKNKAGDAYTGLKNTTGWGVPTSREAQELVQNGERIGSGLKSDAYHRSATFASNDIASKGSVFRFRSGDRVEKTLVQTPGEVNGKAGRFEWIVEADGKISHQMFVEGGKINGVPVR